MRTRTLDALRRLGAALVAAAALCARPASAATTTTAYLNIDVQISGITGVHNLTAVPGVSTGMINLTWTEPYRVGTTGPHLYEMRVSTTGQISTHAQFLAAQLLGVFTGDTLPLPGVGGGGVGVTLTGLQEGVVHYFALVEKDALTATGIWTRTSGWNANNFATPPSLFVSTRTPMEPLGVVATPAPNSLTLAWQPVEKYIDGTPFVDPLLPTPDELVGYSLFRSLTPCSTSFIHVSSVPYGTLNITDNTGGLNYYYRLYSYNNLDRSTPTPAISALGDRSYYSDDCRAGLVLDASMQSMLNGATNGLGADVRIAARRRPEDVTGTVFQSMEWKAMLDGVTEIRNFVLPKPVRISLGFEMVNGVPVPSTGPVGTLAFPSPGGAAAGVNDLGAYWHNGAEFKKVYGKVDAVGQTVTVESPNLGLYQIRALKRADSVVFDASNISNRVLTPNGDGKNDLTIFTYDPGPRNERVTGSIYDVHGSRVADMVPGFVPNTMTWDGRSNGRVVASGVYIYKLEGGGKTFTGTVVVAR